jgi:hypothetical protein
MKMIKNNKWLLLVALTMIACSDDDAVVINDTADGMPLTAGTADFSKYISLILFFNNKTIQEIILINYIIYKLYIIML